MAKKEAPHEEAGGWSTERMYRPGVRKPWEYLGGDEAMFEPKRFPEGVEAARISVTLGLTLNLGDYESAKVSVTATLPCCVEELEEAFEAARDFAGQKLIEEKKKVDATLRDKGRK